VSGAEFFWRNTPPQNDVRELVIARLELAGDCTVARVISQAARIAVATQVSRVFSYALEGEKDIDSNNSKKIFFHVRGRKPGSVTLYLRASKFSSLYYTELGSHSHDAKVNGSLDSAEIRTGGPLDKNTLAAYQLSHAHSLADAVTLNENTADHAHGLTVEFGETLLNPVPPGEGNERMIVTQYKYPAPYVHVAKISGRRNILSRVNGVIDGGAHTHGFANGAETAVHSDPYDHIHRLSIASSVEAAGASDIVARTGESALDWVRNLRVLVDGSDKTEEILAQIRNGTTAQGWISLGDGLVSHPIVGSGTGPIRLDILSNLSFDKDEHSVELKVVDPGNGGCIHYNLYIE
jgi:hypothetical protein